MTRKDHEGNPISHGEPDAIAGYQRAATLFHRYAADPLAAIDETLAAHPDFVMGHCLRAGLICTATDKAFDVELRRSVEAAEACGSDANDRERGHTAACRAWLGGDFERATELWGRVSIEHPRDLVALQLAHLGDFYLGQASLLRDRPARLLSALPAGSALLGYALGMYAFGLEESGELERADRVGRQAVELDAQDAWAVHAVAHVSEMQGRTTAGRQWLQATAQGWSASTMAFHNHWHLALFDLEEGDAAAALARYDRDIHVPANDNVLELIDASALLWRLHSSGHDTGDRAHALATRWRARIDDGHTAFNDVHAIMCLLVAGDETTVDRQLATLARAASQTAQPTNAMMSREVGLPLAQGLREFARGRYDSAIDLLSGVRGRAHRFGGSHAQRDVVTWTLREAAFASGRRQLAQALVAERMAARPESPANTVWTQRLAAL